MGYGSESGGGRTWCAFGVPLVASLALLAGALWLLTDATTPLYLVGLVIVIFLVVGTQNAWNVLLAGRFDVSGWGIRRTEPEGDDGQPT